MRVRTGYLSRCEGFLNAFKDYSTNVIQRVDKGLGDLNNDWREVRPTGEFCVTFLQSFLIRDFILTKPYDIIPLDACLDWLFWKESDKEEDYNRFSVKTRMDYDQLVQDQGLREIYESTGFKDDAIPDNIKGALDNYLHKLMGFFTENPTSGCHSLWLEAYNDFIEDVYLADCEEDENCEYFNLPGSMKDSYLKAIVSSTIDASQVCYEVMLEGIVPMMEDRLSPPKSFWSMSSSKDTPASKQAAKNNWGEGMLRVLQLASDTERSQPVDLVKVVMNLERLKHEDRKAIKKFTKALGEYALSDQTINVASNDNDFSGRKRFGKSMSNLCRPFMPDAAATDDSEENRNPFEFYSVVYSLVRLTNHESIFGIRKPQLEEDILENHWEALYLAVFACQLISTSHAELNYDKNKASFMVGLKPHAHILIDDWPIEVLKEKIPSQMPDLAEQPVQAPVSAPVAQAAPIPVAPLPSPEPSYPPFSQVVPVHQHGQYPMQPGYGATAALNYPVATEERPTKSVFSGIRFKFPISFSRNGRSDRVDPIAPPIAPLSAPPAPPQLRSIDPAEVERITGLKMDTLLSWREIHGKWPSKIPVDMIPSLEQLPREAIRAKVEETRLQFQRAQETYKKQLEEGKRISVAPKPTEPAPVPLAFNFKRKVTPRGRKGDGKSRGSYDMLKVLDA